MTTIWLYTILSVLAISLVSFLGVFFMALNVDRLRRVLLFLVSFAAGSLLGDVFLHLLPELTEAGGKIISYSLVILLGILLFFILEKILYWRHCHIPTTEDHPHPLGMNNLIGDGLHNFIDGLIIAGSYLVSPALGLATTLAVFLHEIPQEIGDFGILIHAGYTKGRAIFYNFISALAALVGAVVAILLTKQVEQTEGYLVALTIGGFLYIATADLIPELKKESGLGKSIWQLVSLLAGIGVMALLLLLEK